jgi:hypothetical protein
VDLLALVQRLPIPFEAVKMGNFWIDGFRRQIYKGLEIVMVN